MLEAIDGKRVGLWAYNNEYLVGTAKVTRNVVIVNGASGVRYVSPGHIRSVMIIEARRW